MKIKDPVQQRMILWLLSGCFLVFGMVIVGGITRLTGSGLSITEWKVITGSIPPLNEAQWMEEFDKYKQIPQYRQMNAHFTLSDFKFIYFWEYIHRLFGRMIGLVFLGGFIYFLWKKAVPRELMPKLLMMFVLGGIQGFLGWYMVSSGLTQNVRVSHLRLAVHLTFAFITFGYVFSVALGLIFPKPASNAKETSFLNLHANALLLLLLLQIIYGAFVAGTKAGWTYNTWPKMGDEWMPESLSFAFAKDGIFSLINNIASIQFIHRMLAYLIAVWVLFFARNAFVQVKLQQGQKAGVQVLLLGVFLQIVLGIATLLLQVPTWMGVMHQALAFLLFGTCIFLRHRFRFQTDL